LKASTSIHICIYIGNPGVALLIWSLIFQEQLRNYHKIHWDPLGSAGFRKTIQLSMRCVCLPASRQECWVKICVKVSGDYNLLFYQILRSLLRNIDPTGFSS